MRLLSKYVIMNPPTPSDKRKWNHIFVAKPIHKNTSFHVATISTQTVCVGVASENHIFPLKNYHFPLRDEKLENFDYFSNSYICLRVWHLLLLNLRIL